MRSLFHQKYIPATVALLLAVVSVVVLSLPPEVTLGTTIRIVLLHGALARTGLFAFAAAGLLGLALLIRPNADLASWTRATQQTSFVVWLAAALTSAVATYLSWGVVIAWSEPRTQGTIKILFLAVVLLVLVLWIRQHRFTGLANVVLAAFSWWTVLGATSVQHPENPVGSPTSGLYRLSFFALVALLAAAAALSVWWLRELQSRSDTG